MRDGTGVGAATPRHAPPRRSRRTTPPGTTPGRAARRVIACYPRAVASRWITAIAVPHLVRAVTAAGVDARHLDLRDLPVDARYEDHLPLERVIALWEQALAVTGRRDLPLLAATRTTVDERSLLGFVVANQPRLGDGVDRLDRYFPTVSDSYRWTIAGGEPGHGELVFRCEPCGPVERAGWQAYLEFEAVDLIGVGRRLAGAAASPRALTFVHAAPPALAATFSRALGLPVTFGADATAIVYPAAVRELAVPTARPSLATLVEERLDRMLVDLAAGTDVATRARARVGALLRRGQPTVAALAAELHLSRRSLERALAAAGTRGAALFEEERRRLALAWLPHHTVDEVAARLGYADGRAFARAFKRWTGQAPGRLRLTAAAR